MSLDYDDRSRSDYGNYGSRSDYGNYGSRSDYGSIDYKGLQMTEDEVIPRKNSHANRIVNLTGIIMQLTGVSKWGV